MSERLSLYFGFGSLEELESTNTDMRLYRPYLVAAATALKEKSFLVVGQELGGELTSPEAIYSVRHSQIVQADAYIAELSRPSTDVGVELGIAHKAGKPVLGLWNSRLGLPLDPRIEGYAQTMIGYKLKMIRFDDPQKVGEMIESGLQGLTK